MNRKHNKSMIILFLTPAIIAYLLVFLYPTVRTLIMSFFYTKGLTDPIAKWDFVGLENFKKLLATPLFRTSVKNMSKIWLIGGVLNFFFAFLFSIILHSGARGKSFWRAAIYLPNVITAIAIANMWNQYVYNTKYGFLKTFFDSIGMHKLAATQWTSPSNIFMAMLIAYTFGCVGYYLLILLAGMERIPTDFYEAAKLEGANIIKQFFQITLPLLKPVLVTCLTFWTTSTIGFFVWSQMFSSVNDDMNTITPVVYMYSYAFGKGTSAQSINTGIAAAVGTFLCILTLVVFTLINQLNRGEQYEY